MDLLQTLLAKFINSATAHVCVGLEYTLHEGQLTTEASLAVLSLTSLFTAQVKHAEGYFDLINSLNQVDIARVTLYDQF